MNVLVAQTVRVDTNFGGSKVLAGALQLVRRRDFISSIRPTYPQAVHDCAAAAELSALAV